MPRGKTGMLLDRKTLLFAAEASETHDACVLCGHSLTQPDKHASHRQAMSLQRAAQITIGIKLRSLAATAVDLKGLRRRVARA